MTATDEERLQSIFRREYRSLLQYVRESSPYAVAGDRKILSSIQRIASEEADVVQIFGDFLSTRRIGIPYLGSYPIVFTDLNFVNVRYLLPKLIVEQKKDLNTLELDISLLTDTSAQSSLRPLVDLHRQHLSELERLGSSLS